MSNMDLRDESSAPHRGFTVKAREVLLEPPAPFAITKEISGSCSNIAVDSPKAPHRGFTAKAREMLVERQTQDNHHSLKFPLEAVRTELDIFHKQPLSSGPHSSKLDRIPSQRAATVLGIRNDKTAQQIRATYPTTSRTVAKAYEEKKVEIPHSKLSRIKAHKLLGDIGKTRSANDIFYDKYRKRLRTPSPCDYSATNIRRGTVDDTAMCGSLEALQIDVNDEDEKASELPDQHIP